MADVFVSYVREDRDIAEKMAGGLSAAGFSVWWDRHIRGGVEFAAEIQRQLDAAKVVIVLWSGNSLDSRWVRDEAEQAHVENKLIPVRLDGVQPPLGFRQTQALDFAGWKGDEKGGVFPSLVESVRYFVGDGASIPSGQSATSSEPTRSHWSASRRWLAVGATALVAGTAALLIVWPHFGSEPTLDGHDGRIEIAAFETLTTSDELEHFAKTIAPTIVHVLATSGVKAIAPGKVDGGVEGSKSGAEFALHGRVDREGDNLVVSGDVLNRRDALVLWSITQKRTAAQPAVLQEQFSWAVAWALSCALDARRLNGDPSTDLFAQELRLCEAYASAIEQTPELARRIVETAPQYASSYWTQALANAIVSTTPTLRLRGDRPPAEIARLRKVVYDSARVAVEMDPRFDPVLARAIVVDPAVGLAQREKYLQQSLEGEGLKSFSFAMQGCLLETVGRIREARIAFERAANENPLDFNARLMVATLAAKLGNMAIARHEFDEMRKKTPDFGVDLQQWWTETWFGDGAIPKALYDRIKEQGARLFSCPDLPAVMADARAENARPSEEEIGRACVHGWLAFAYFGYVDAAFRALETDPRLRPIDSIQYYSAYTDLFLPHMRVVHADARFMPLAARLGLVDYWLDTDQWPDFCKEEKLPYDCKEAALAARAAKQTRNADAGNPP